MNRQAKKGSSKGQKGKGKGKIIRPQHVPHRWVRSNPVSPTKPGVQTHTKQTGNTIPKVSRQLQSSPPNRQPPPPCHVQGEALAHAVPSPVLSVVTVQTMSVTRPCPLGLASTPPEGVTNDDALREVTKAACLEETHDHKLGEAKAESR